jgi:uncharacterized membrane protein YqjE
MANQADRSLADVLQDIVANIQEIVRSEVRLAKAEIREEGLKAGRAAAMLGAGALLGVYAIGFLLFTGVRALELVVAPWLAGLIVTVVVALTAAVMIQVGRKRFQLVHPTPEKTIQTVKENVEWVKDRTR